MTKFYFVTFNNTTISPSAATPAQAGTTVVDMQVTGRWKLSEMPAHYTKTELAERDTIARFKDGKR